jgi:uncharacterized protein (TIGR03085 family)
VSTRKRFIAERRAVALTLAGLGPDKPTLCPGWDTAAMAAHLASADAGAGLATWGGRRLVAAGARLNDMKTNRMAAGYMARRTGAKGFQWALEHLTADPPRLLGVGVAGVVSLFEVWVHHEDVRRANGMGPDPGRDYHELVDCLRFVARYQHKRIGDLRLVVLPPAGRSVTVGQGSASLVVRGAVSEALLWLAGRPQVAAVEFDDPQTAAAIPSLSI